MPEAIDPKQFLINAFVHAQESQKMILALDESHLDVKQIEAISKRLSLAATEVTKLKTWMLGNLPPIQDDDH